MGNNDLRLFVGIKLPQPYQELLGSVTERWRPRLKSRMSWTKQGNWHLTLQFLGHVPEEIVGSITDALSCVSCRPFLLQGGQGGFFPNIRRPRVFWLGLEQGVEPCVELAGKVAQELRPLGYSPDRAEFKPHLTLARIREDRRDAWDELKDDLNHLQWPPFTVEQFFLFKSTLSPQGARYESLSEFQLRDFCD